MGGNLKRKNITGAVLAIYISCAFAVQPVSAALMGDAEAFKLYSPASKLADGYLVWIKKDGDKWSYVRAGEFYSSKVKDYRLDTIRDNKDEEILYFSNDLNIVQPYYGNWELAPLGGFECSIFEGNTYYTPCGSRLTETMVGASIGKTIIAAALTFGLAAGTHQRINRDRMLSAIDSAGAVNMLKTHIADAEKKRNYEQYQKSFGALSDSASIRFFLENHAKNDPDNLIPKANEMLVVVLKKEEEQRKLDAERAEVLRKQQALEEKKQQEAAAKKEKEELAAISAFRKNIRSGADSYCGLVIEVKKPLVQVQTPAGANWMKIEETYPAGLKSCPYEKPAPVVQKEEVSKPQYDKAGRKIIRGPVHERYLNNVHIISDSYGVIAMDGAIITDSVIEAPICVKSSGRGLTLKRNELNCQLGVEFTGSILMDNTLMSNSYAGTLSNRDF